MHRNTSRQKRFYTPTLLNTSRHKRFYTPTLLQTRLNANAFTQKLFYTQTLLHAILLHTNAFTHKPFRTHRLLHSNLVSCERVAADTRKIAILPQLVTLEPHFVRKMLPPDQPNSQKKTQVSDTRTSFRAKRWQLRGTSSALPAALREKRKRSRETVTRP